MKLKLIIALVASFFVLSACSDYLPKQGEIARVNGRPIFLKSAEVRQDSDTIGLISAKPSDTVEDLRKNYSLALSELIIIELVNEALEKRGLAINSEDLSKEEAVLLADYPEGEFERQLIEDRLDIESWREQLKGRMAVQRFREKVLQPSIVVSEEEFKEYAKAHIKIIPSQKHFMILQASNKEQLNRAVAASLTGVIATNFQVEHPGVFLRERRLAESRIEPDTLKVLSALKPGQAGAIFKDPESEEYLCYILLANIAEQEAGFAESFKVNEEAILEEKLEFAFNAWLQSSLRKAKIKVSKHLLQTQNGKDQELDQAEAESSKGLDPNEMPALPKPEGEEKTEPLTDGSLSNEALSNGQAQPSSNTNSTSK